MPAFELAQLIHQRSDHVHEASRDLQLELATQLRDEMNELKEELRGMDAAGLRRPARHLPCRRRSRQRVAVYLRTAGLLSPAPPAATTAWG